MINEIMMNPNNVNKEKNDSYIGMLLIITNTRKKIQNSRLTIPTRRYALGYFTRFSLGASPCENSKT